jgi:hypothetical protein
VLTATESLRAAPFVNLDFEQATVPPGTPSPGFIPAPVAFPGWTPRIAEVPQTIVGYNNPGIGEAAVTLYDRPLGPGGLRVLQGSYSAALATDFAFGSRASLEQTGDIPIEAKSLRFLLNYTAHFMEGIPTVSIDGLDLPLVQLSPAQGFNPILFGADVTAYVGSIATLRFSSGTTSSNRLVAFDAVTFSEIPIPEPSVALTLGIALSIAGMCRRHRLNERHR